MSNIASEFDKVTDDKIITPKISKVANVLEFKEESMKENPLSSLKLDKV